MFDPKSRYASLETYEVTDRRGRRVKVVPVPPAPQQDSLGVHLMKEGQRIDHLSARYLNDPAGFWRICEHNDVMLPETLTEAREVKIPLKER